ncbi:MAG: hypothetical protein ACJAUP_002060 [Cellvibrionaceae bacterium]|jgi:hypothetical protein
MEIELIQKLLHDYLEGPVRDNKYLGVKKLIGS